MAETQAAQSPMQQRQSEAVQQGHAEDRQYVVLWGVLVAALVASLLLGALGHTALVVTAIFVVAVLKALIVLQRFMHLKLEPRWVKLVVYGALAVVVVLYFGLVPDIVWVYGEPSATAAAGG